MTRTLTCRVLPLGSDLLHFACFEEPQQHPLHPQRHLADFVEEDRAEMRRLHLSGLVAIRAGETALDMAEQLGLEQRFWQAAQLTGAKTWFARGLRV